jgi:arylsulfatase A-like enzyme
MNRRKFLAQATVGVAALKIPAALGEEAAPGSPDERPNFLFFIADDLTFRVLQSPVHAEVKTPHLDRLAESGCSFTHCFHQGSWSGAVCVPSRTMLNTGLSTFKAENSIPANESFAYLTWGQTFRKAGYDTFITGKWHLDAVSLQRSFAEQAAVAPGFLPTTKDVYERPAAGNNWNPADESLAGHWLHTEVANNETRPQIKHSSSVYADAAAEYLKTKAATRQTPFFMYVGFNAPHDPRQAPQKFLDLYPLEQVKVPPNYLPSQPFDEDLPNDRDEMLAPFPRTEFVVKTHRREYYAIISHMDEQVGRVLAALEASGKAKNTYVIFTADHGLAVGEHGLMGKQNQYECTMRVPMLMRGPGIKAGKKVDELVYQHCMFATTCELAGIPVPSHVEFASLTPMLTDDEPKPMYDAVFGWLMAVQRSVRTKKYRLIFYPRLSRYQLFDMQMDPWEMVDLQSDPKFASVLEEMKGRLGTLQRRLGDPMYSA